MKKPISVHLPIQLPTILALEASANKLSVALMRNGDVAAERHHISAHGHAASIVPAAAAVTHSLLEVRLLGKLG